MKLIILVLAHDSPFYRELEQAIRETWLARIPSGVKAYFYYGDGGKDRTYSVGDCIFSPHEEGIRNIGYKTLDAFRWLLENEEFDFVFRTNLSSYVDIPGLLEYLKDKPRERLYCGHIAAGYNPPFVAGAGYFLSRDVVQLIVKNAAAWDHLYIDDVALGRLLHRLGIPIYADAERVDVTETKDMYLPGYHFRVRNLKDPTVEPRRIRQIHWIRTRGGKGLRLRFGRWSARAIALPGAILRKGRGLTLRRLVPFWARKRVPLSVKRLLAPRAEAPVLGLSGHIPPGLPRGNRKRALVSYITLPFRLAPSDPRNLQFSNIGIARSMARALNDLGCVVDAAHWTDERFRLRATYDFFIGHGGRTAPRLMAELPPAAVKIYFSTGLHWVEQNRLEAARFEALECRRGVRLPADRRIECDETPAYERADGIICLGNDRTRESFSKYPNVIAMNNAAYPVEEAGGGGKDFAAARDGFLFFSGPGNVHKGLDLLLEAFARLDAHLYICQEIEPEFHQAFRREFDELGNIHRIGHIPARSAEFHKLAGRCAWTILPSCAEGQPGGVVECMHFGLVPVVSRECNITTGDFGVTLNDCSVAEIERTVKELSQRPPEWCAEMSRRTRRAAAAEFSEEAFLRNMKSAIARIAGAKKGAAL